LPAVAFDSFKDAFASGKKKAQAGKFVEAGKDYNSALELTRKSDEKAMALFFLGESQCGSKKTADAVKSYNAVLELPQTSNISTLVYKNRSQLRIGQILLQAKKYEQALQELNKVLYMTPDLAFSETYLAIGDCFSGLGKYDKAVESYRRTIKKQGTGAQLKGKAYLKIGKLLHKQKKYDEAITEYKQLLALDKAPAWHIVAAYQGIGNSLREQKKYDESNRMFEKVVSSVKNPYTVGTSLITIGCNLYDQGKYDEAVTYFKKALALGKSLPRYATIRAHYMIGKTLQQQKKLPEAVKAYEEVVMNGSGKFWLEKEAVCQMGYCYFDLKDYDKAKAAFAKVKANPQASSAQKKSAENMLARISASK
ncbi:MAG: tetratricopeptide repeat protein, partial [Victivallales bacterium]|nr:tetratricopeptide repeat protein [Victivallales bacterium]